MQEAQAAKQHTQGYNLDKRHAFKVNMFDEFDKFLKTSDSYEAPEDKEYQPTENLQVSNAIVSRTTAYNEVADSKHTCSVDINCKYPF